MLKETNIQEKDLSSLEESLKTPFRLKVILSTMLRHVFLSNDKTKSQAFSLSEDFANEMILSYKEKGHSMNISKIRIVDTYVIIGNIVFDISGNFPSISQLNPESVEEKRQEKFRSYRQEAEKIEKGLDAIEGVFSKKSNEWFGNLSNEEKIQGGEYEGKTLLEIQKIIEQGFKNVSNIPGISKELRELVQKSKERYLRYIVGIGNKYERGAAFFKKTPKQLGVLISLILKGKSGKESLDFLYEVHRDMYKNTFQSSQVKESYKVFVKELHAQIFRKLVLADEDDKTLLEFAKIITGRGGKIVERRNGRSINKIHENYVDSEFYDPKLSNEVIIHLFTKKGGVMEKMKDSERFKLEDPKVGNTAPTKIVTESKEIIKKFVRVAGKKQNPDNYLKSIGCEEVMNLKGDEKYSDLKIEQQISLSLLVRFIEKVKEKTSTKTVPASYNEFGTLVEEQKIIGQEFVEAQSILLEVREEAFKVVSSSIGKSTSKGSLGWITKTAKELGFTGIDAEIYNLFQDIQGNGLFNISDEWSNSNKNGVKTIGGMALIFGTAFGVGVITAPVAGPGLAVGSVTYLGKMMVSGMVVGASASVASIGTDILLHGKGFETPLEAIDDIGSDVVLGGVTGLLGGPLLQKGLNSISKGTLGIHASNKFVFGAEIVGLGIVPEMGRQYLIDKTYRSGSVFQDDVDQQYTQEKEGEEENP